MNRSLTRTLGLTITKGRTGPLFGACEGGGGGNLKRQRKRDFKSPQSQEREYVKSTASCDIEESLKIVFLFYEWRPTNKSINIWTSINHDSSKLSLYRSQRSSWQPRAGYSIYFLIIPENLRGLLHKNVWKKFENTSTTVCIPHKLSKTFFYSDNQLAKKFF